MTTCSHASTHSTWQRCPITGDEYELARHCYNCDARLGMGEADEPGIDIGGAMLLAGFVRLEIEVADIWAVVDDDVIFEIGRNGDDGTWPWDPSRPVAGQYEEWVAARDRAIDTQLEAAMKPEPGAAHPDTHFVNCDKFTHDAFPCNCRGRGFAKPGALTIETVFFAEPGAAYPDGDDVVDRLMALSKDDVTLSFDTGRGPYRAVKVDHDALAALFDSECDAVIAADVARGNAIDEHGYGRPPTDEPAQVIGLIPYIPAVIPDSELRDLDARPPYETGGES